jgi:beta-glucosidase
MSHPAFRPTRRWVWLFRAAIALVLVLPLIAWPGRTNVARADTGTCPWMDTSQTPDVRAQELMDAMTLQQKMRWLDEQAANTPSQTTFSGVTYPAQVPCTPLITYADGPWEVTGVSGVTTGFPVPIAQTATWDPQLSWDKGQAMGDEAFQEDRNGLLAPGINLARVPYGGRNAEFMGEDPILAGTLAGQTVAGMQNGNPTEPVEAVLKHWVANDQELDRQTSSSNVDDRTLQELDGLAFDVAIRDGQPGGVMCSYNQVNGVYACENPTILNGYLKTELAYKGFVVSDFGAVHTTAPSLNAGLDQELNRPRFYSPANLQAALTAGTITEAQIDQAAFRVARSAIATGLFDHPMPATPAANASTAAHLALAAKMAEEGSVLLKNDNALPLSGTGLNVAVIGPTASATATSGVSARTVCTSNGEPSAACTNNPGFVAPLDAITARAAQAGDTVTFDNGSNLASAAATAAAANVAVVFGYYTEGEGSDRTNINLDNGGDALISAVAAANPNTIVVLETGSAVLMPWLDQVKGVLEAWYPGVQQGNAIAALLWGDANPSGKLPVTFPKSTADLPTAGSGAQYPGIFTSTGTTTPPNPRNGEIRQVNYTEGLKLGYRWYDSQNIAPLFPFGYGLSYTTFAEHLASVTPDGDGGANVDVAVTNTGSRSGAQVVEVYVQDPASSSEPSKQLESFNRVTLDSGVTQTVHLHLAPWAFAHWDTSSSSWLIDGGAYTVDLGTDEATIVDSWPVTLPACTVAGTATVATCAATPVSTPEGSPFSGSVAAFTAYNPAAAASEYGATIDWGDGTSTTTGTVTAVADGRFTVDGLHTYADNGNYNVTTTITDDAQFTGSTVVTTSPATVSNVPPTATFNAPASVFAGSSFTLSLTNATDASSVDVAAGFQYAFDCGDGSGFGAFGSASSVTCPTTSVAVRTVRGEIRDKDGGVTKYTASVPVIVTAQSLCNLTKQFVEGSAKYQALRPNAKAAVDALLTSACNSVANVKPATNPILKAVAVALYKLAVGGLAQSGWLTSAQAAELRNLAGSL